MSREKPWHVAIYWDGSYNSRLFFDPSRDLNIYRDEIDCLGGAVVECIELSENDMDRITGAVIANNDESKPGRFSVGPLLLKNLVRRLNTCEGLNPQEELDKLCGVRLN